MDSFTHAPDTREGMRATGTQSDRFQEDPQATLTSRATQTFKNCAKGLEKCRDEIRAMTITGQEPFTASQMQTILRVSSLSNEFMRSFLIANPDWCRCQSGNFDEGTAASPEALEVHWSTGNIMRSLSEILQRTAPNWLSAAQKTFEQSLQELEGSRKIMTLLDPSISELQRSLMKRSTNNIRSLHQSKCVYDLCLVTLGRQGRADPTFEQTIIRLTERSQEEYNAWMETSKMSRDLYFERGTKLLSDGVDSALNLIVPSNWNISFQSADQGRLWEQEREAHRKKLREVFPDICDNQALLDTLSTIPAQSDHMYHEKRKQWITLLRELQRVGEVCLKSNESNSGYEVVLPTEMPGSRQSGYRINNYHPISL